MTTEDLAACTAAVTAPLIDGLSVLLFSVTAPTYTEAEEAARAVLADPDLMTWVWRRPEPEPFPPVDRCDDYCPTCDYRRAGHCNRPERAGF